MNGDKIAWHKIPGNGELQISYVMEPVKDYLNGKIKRLPTGSQGFDLDELAAKEFVLIIKDELNKLGLDGHHDLHQSKSGSGKWYYNLKTVWKIGNEYNSGQIYFDFRDARDIARAKLGTIKRCGEGWVVLFNNV